jgi:hypothetical protein
VRGDAVCCHGKQRRKRKFEEDELALDIEFRMLLRCPIGIF